MTFHFDSRPVGPVTFPIWKRKGKKERVPFSIITFGIVGREGAGGKKLNVDVTSVYT